MPQNLRARLTRIRNAREQVFGRTTKTADSLNSSSVLGDKLCVSVPLREVITKTSLSKTSSGTAFSTWHESGYKLLRRTLILPFALPANLPQTLPWLLPDLSRNEQAAEALSGNGNFSVTLPDTDKFLFFDLETTGLSGGAGTVAFLAAFGRFVCKPEKNLCPEKRNYTHLEVTQFLLLDYPGESDFLEKVLAFISASAAPCFLTSYNGKAFDTQILKTRCLMNGFKLPVFFQLDLLHPARRLWKRILPGCSQAVVETHVLGLDRTGDTPGAMAPDIWFHFLRSGEDFSGQKTETSRALLEICEHNVKDIFGMASLLRAFAEIAASPLNAATRFNVDEENLAMCWRRFFYRLKPIKNSGFCDAKLQSNRTDQNKTGVIRGEQEKITARLLEEAAKKYPRSCLRLGFDLFRRGCYKEGRAELKRLTVPAAKWKVPCTAAAEALALRSLAIDAQRRLGQNKTALEYIEQALVLAPSLPAGLREDLERRAKLFDTIFSENSF